MWSRTGVLLLFLTLGLGSELKRSYKDYAIVRVYANNTEQQDLLREFIEANPNNVQYGKEGKDEIDLILSPDFVARTLDLAQNVWNLDTWIVENDLQRAIDEENSEEIEQSEMQRAFNSGDEDLKLEENSCFGAFDFRSYHHFNVIADFIDCIGRSYPEVAKVIDIGKSTEGRPIKVVKISKPGTQASKSIFIEGGIHAREWISPSSALYIMYLYIARNDKFPDIFNHYDVYILPVLNPDGYEYTHTTDRMWRKTRSKHGRCYGVDPNRNFDYKWGGQGTSGYACSDIYRGRRPFSEPELRALRDFIMPRKDEFILYLAMHSYGQYILYPWGYERKDARNVKELKKLGEIGANAASFKYQVGNSAKLLYPAAGNYKMKLLSVPL